MASLAAAKLEKILVMKMSTKRKHGSEEVTLVKRSKLNEARSDRTAPLGRGQEQGDRKDKGKKGKLSKPKLTGASILIDRKNTAATDVPPEKYASTVADVLGVPKQLEPEARTHTHAMHAHARHAPYDAMQRDESRRVVSPTTPRDLTVT